LAVVGDADHLDSVAEDEATGGRLTRTGRDRGGSHDDAGSLVADETADPGDGHGDANAQEHQTEHDRDPTKIHHVEGAPVLGWLVGAQMTGHTLGELVWRQALRPFHRVLRVDTHRRGPTSF
jgi:hypothetical protein